MNGPSIGISGINAVDNPGPGIGVARSLKEDAELAPRIIGLAYDALEPGIYMDWVVDHSFILPYPSGEGDACFERLAYVREQHGLDLVIPNLDAELPLYVKRAPQLEKLGIRTFLPSIEQFRLRGKDRLREVADKIGIKLPRTCVVNSLEQLYEAVTEIGLPVMVKGCFYKAYHAYTTTEAVSHYHAIVAEWGYPVIIQQVVAGEELNVVGLGDGEGGSLGRVGIKKISVTSLGKIWTGVTVRHQPMLDAAERFVRGAKWRGPYELECIVKDKDVYLIEINPRFPAWVYFATGVGVNLPARLARLAGGRDAPRATEYEAGKLFVRYTYELVSDMSKFQKAVTRGEV